MSQPDVLQDDYRASPSPPRARGLRQGRGRRGRVFRSRRILASKGVREAVVSLAGLMGGSVRNQAEQEIGRLHDVVASWSDGQTYPPITGLVVRIGRRLAFVDASAIHRLGPADVLLRSSRLDLRDFARRPDEVILGHDVLDHQLVDVDGVQVIRAADLYLAEVLGRIRLVGVDVSAQTLLRRLGPRRWRPRPTPDRVIDWAAIQPFAEGTAESQTVRLRTSNEGIHRLRPGELADLLEDLRRPERQELLATLDPEEAADALEEMDPDELTSLLHDAQPDQAARLLARMEPDEAADALRDLSPDNRQELLGRMPAGVANALVEILGYPEDRAGGIMTTALVTALAKERVSAVADRLAQAREHHSDIDAVAVLDSSGNLVGDLSLLELAVALRADPDMRARNALGDEEPLTVSPEATAADAVDCLIDARRLSVLVVDNGRPVGRILADDLLDVLAPSKGRFHFHRLLQ